MESLWREGLRNKWNPHVYLGVTHPGILKQKWLPFLSQVLWATHHFAFSQSLLALCLFTCQLQVPLLSQFLWVPWTVRKERSMSDFRTGNADIQNSESIRFWSTKLSVQFILEEQGNGWMISSWNDISRCLSAMHLAMATTYGIVSAKAILVTHLRLYWNTTFCATNPSMVFLA